MTKLKAVFIGECMVELSNMKNGLLQKSFAGDVFNSAVYMKRIAQDSCDVSVLTAIGEDNISSEMEEFFDLQGLGTDTILKSSAGTVGLYLISTDFEGERSFSYWREISKAYQVSDIIFPGVEEEVELFGAKSVEDCLSRFNEYENSEIVLKAGEEGMYVKSGEELVHLEFKPAEKVVDTTAAGDAFDGTYLAMRISDNNIKDSLAKAAEVAAKVVTYPGAIVPEYLTR